MVVGKGVIDLGIGLQMFCTFAERPLAVMPMVEEVGAVMSCPASRASLHSC